MVYKLKWNEGRKTFESRKTFSTKASAQKKLTFIKQIDDDLPRNMRDKSLKTFRIVKAANQKRIR